MPYDNWRTSWTVFKTKLIYVSDCCNCSLSLFKKKNRCPKTGHWRDEQVGGKKQTPWGKGRLIEREQIWLREPWSERAWTKQHRCHYVSIDGPPIKRCVHYRTRRDGDALMWLPEGSRTYPFGGITSSSSSASPLATFNLDTSTVREKKQSTPAVGARRPDFFCTNSIVG